MKAGVPKIFENRQAGAVYSGPQSGQLPLIVLFYSLYLIQEPSTVDESENSTTLSKNPSYAEQKEATLLEIDRSQQLLDSYHDRLIKEKQEEKDQEHVIIRKIYKMNIDEGKLEDKEDTKLVQENEPITSEEQMFGKER